MASEVDPQPPCDPVLQSLLSLASRLARCEPKNKSKFANLITDAQAHFIKWPLERQEL